MAKKRFGAGNFVQPNDDDGYDVYIKWEVKEKAKNHALAVAMLHYFVSDKKVIRINDHSSTEEKLYGAY